MTGMLQGETIIYFGPEPWAGLWRNRHQLMSRFADHNNVWYVEPPTLLRDLLGMRRSGGGNPGKRRSRLFSRDASGVKVFHSPWWLPITGRFPFKSLSIRLFMFFLSVVAGTGRRRRPIVWVSRPNLFDYVGKLHEKLTIYHVVDEYSGYGHPSKSHSDEVDQLEIRLLRAVDTVIVVTPSLYELKSPHNPNTHVVANAVDYAAFANGDRSKPDDMSNIQGPIIGYSGLIAARLDLKMLLEAASARPQWNFVFVGAVDDKYCEAELQQLRALANVHFLGPKAVQDLPRYVHQFDVCTVPYVLNLRAQHASPLKLYEYAAASRPIVSADFAAARSFGGHVKMVGDASEFVAACEQSLTLNSSAAEIIKNRELAAQNTWAHRIQQLSEILRSAAS